MLSNRNDDLLQRDADIAVRMMRPTQKALVARRIGEVRSGLFAHRRYIEAFGMPQSLDRITGRRTIGFDRDMYVIRTAGRPVAHLLLERFNFRCDSVPAQMAALRAGLGIAACHMRVAERDPDLVPVFADIFSVAVEAWLVMHEDAKATQRIRLLYDHLANELSIYVRGK